MRYGLWVCIKRYEGIKLVGMGYMSCLHKYCEPGSYVKLL